MVAFGSSRPACKKKRGRKGLKSSWSTPTGRGVLRQENTFQVDVAVHRRLRRQKSKAPVLQGKRRPQVGGNAHRLASYFFRGAKKAIESRVAKFREAARVKMLFMTRRASSARATRETESKCSRGIRQGEGPMHGESETPRAHKKKLAQFRLNRNERRAAILRSKIRREGGECPAGFVTSEPQDFTIVILSHVLAELRAGALQRKEGIPTPEVVESTQGPIFSDRGTNSILRRISGGWEESGGLGVPGDEGVPGVNRTFYLMDVALGQADWDDSAMGGTEGIFASMVASEGVTSYQMSGQWGPGPGGGWTNVLPRFEEWLERTGVEVRTLRESGDAQSQFNLLPEYLTWTQAGRPTQGASR